MRYHEVSGCRQTVPFLDDPVQEMCRAEIVISRAGAVTLAELADSGAACILVPMHDSADNHQSLNARLFTEDCNVHVSNVCLLD